MGSSRMQADATGKTLARASTVGKPFKAYKPHQPRPVGRWCRQSLPGASDSNLCVFRRLQTGVLAKRWHALRRSANPSKPTNPTKRRPPGRLC